MRIVEFRRIIRKNFSLLGSPYAGQALPDDCSCPLGVAIQAVSSYEKPQRPIPRAAAFKLDLSLAYCSGVIAGWDGNDSHSFHGASEFHPEHDLYLRGKLFGKRLRRQWYGLRTVKHA